MTELVYDDAAFLQVGQALTSLQAEQFIKPELPGFAAGVFTIMQEYPAAAAPLTRRGRGFFNPLRWLAIVAAGRDLSPAPKSRRYVRTLAYRGGWAANLVGLGIQMLNPVPYSGFVGGLDASPGGRGGKGNQPYTWRYGWRRLKKVAMDRMDQWILEMESKAFRLWERKP